MVGLEGNGQLIPIYNPYPSAETVAAISQAKGSNPFTKGVHGRDLAAKLLIPKHITAKWQHKCGELRALK